MGSPTVVVISGACLLLFAIPSQAQSPVADLGALNLKVAEAKVVPELPLSGSMSGPQFQVRPEKGTKLVAVTLTGELKAPGRYVVAPQLFAVLFEEDRAGMGPTVKVVGGHHVAADALPGDVLRWSASYVTSATRPSSVTIRFAVTVPEAVENLQILHATGIGGPVKLAPK